MNATHNNSAGITLKITSSAEQISLLSESLHALCLYATGSEKCALDVQCAAVEALNNVVLHAYNNQPDHDVTVCWYLENRRLRIEIIDCGVSMSRLPEPVLPPFDAEGGRGWWIINTCIDEYYYNVVETVVRERRLKCGSADENRELNFNAPPRINTLTLIKQF